MSDSDPEDRTEEASPERRRKAREDGQFPRARDTGAIAATGAVLISLFGFGSQLSAAAKHFAERCFRDSDALHGAAGLAVIGRETMGALALLTLPIAAIAAIAAVALGFAEAGFHPNIELAAPKFERLDPLAKLPQLFSPTKAGLNSILALARVGVVFVVTWNFTKDRFPSLVRLSGARVGNAVADVGDAVLHLAASATLALVTLTAVDYFKSWMQHEKSIRMSRQELKEEHHQQEGDPRVRGRQRARAREMLRRGIAKAIKTADVVIANPTHVSVALRYRPQEGAPVVVAKGYDEIALHIRKLAGENSVPIVENVPLARALAEKVKVGRAVPVELYVAVAEVLAMVYRAKNRGRRA
ncbi:MAG TPA: EscU/YscU/HrcU family type III secretion system export apparatus switch protein [Polyangiaceae bacterium]|nr:EscU/YscU/HrcU family type III secretion system export apparatus switch protein [Polyangiaceae bacterium]